MLLFRLHAFGDAVEPQAPRKVDDGVDDRRGAFMVRQIANEGAVDLDPIEREATQISE